MTEKEALAYAIKMRMRGDTYAQIYRFIATRVSEEQTNKTLKTVNEFEVKSQKEEMDNGKLIGIMFGGVFILVGVVLLFMTLPNGVISSIPFWLIGIGIAGIIGGLK